jgi:long-chain acyl-CoA synthetase
MWEFYGATEGQATRISPDEWLARPGSVGRPRSGAEIVIADETGASLPPGNVGEVWIRDPHEPPFEYWGDEQKTKEAWRQDAFTVGDLGRLDAEGYLWLEGRKHDTIISGGVNVYPKEVEAALASHPGIEEALVYGAPHPEWGEQVAAFVVAAPGRAPAPEALRSWLRDRLSPVKCPRHIEFVDELPRTPGGKLKRPSGALWRDGNE